MKIVSFHVPVLESALLKLLNEPLIRPDFGLDPHLNNALPVITMLTKTTEQESYAQVLICIQIPLIKNPIYKITGSKWKRLRARDWLTAVLMWDYVNIAISRCFSLLRYSAFVIVLLAFRARVSTHFSFSQTCTRVYITRCKHGKCFLFFNHQMKVSLQYSCGWYTL